MSQKHVSITDPEAIKDRNHWLRSATLPQEKSPPPSPSNRLFEHNNGGCLFSLSWEAVPQFCTSIRKTFLPICECFLWYPQVSLRIFKAARAAGGVSCEKTANRFCRCTGKYEALCLNAQTLPAFSVDLRPRTLCFPVQHKTA